MELPKTMRAVIFEKVGCHKMLEAPTPQLRNPDDLLVKIEACSICGSDLHILADPPGCIAVPGMIIGHEMVGQVVAVGKKVTNFAPGDRLVCDPNISCGSCYQCRTGHSNMCENLHIHGVDLPGFFAQYACIPEWSAVKISKDLPTELAIFSEPLTCVMSAVNKIRLLPGENAVVIGAGPIGLYFLSLLKANGAGKVISVEPSEYRRSSAAKMGAALPIDPRAENAAEIIKDLTGGRGADAVVDAVGMCIADALKYVCRGGRVLLFGQNGAATETICQNDITRNEITLMGSYIGPYTLNATVKLLESRLIDFRKMITHKLPLSEFDVGLAAMRSGNALEVILYPNEQTQ